MSQQSIRLNTVRAALFSALGGFLMGFDASVISGVVQFIETEFQLNKIELGWSVASLTLTATLAMMVAGPLSDRFGRRPVMFTAALLFFVSAVASALAPNFETLVAARMLGGFGVGAALIIAPLYIGEMAPPDQRGRLVSLNQLNIVIGISAAYFSNYLILSLGQGGGELAQTLQLDTQTWRWMLGVEALPALIYFLALFFVPESPRWLFMKGRPEEARQVLGQFNEPAVADQVFTEIGEALEQGGDTDGARWRELVQPATRLVLVLGISIAVLQQITGINAIFFYAPMIFEQSGVGTDAAFMQAVLVGLVNLVFTIVAIASIDRFGRRPLLIAGVSVIFVCLSLLSWGFGRATYELDAQALASLPAALNQEALMALSGQVFDSDVAFRVAVVDVIGQAAWTEHSSALIKAAIEIQSTLILLGILGFVAGFAMSLGPVMWVLFSELFPNRIRGLAISLCGLVNSGVSFLVQQFFPWELENFGNSLTFMIYAGFAFLGLIIVLKLLPETRGKSLEALETELARG
jgi:sugar porter (SP) family MFS transporter